MRLKLAPSRKLAEKTERVKSAASKEEEKMVSEAALLDTVARILRAELSQLEDQPGGLVGEGDIARFLQAAKVRPTLNLSCF